MERKAPLPSIFRNKKASKAPESGTPRVGNQLVRMRSPFPLLNDMETGTAPTLALSNTSTSNTAETQETGDHTRPPVFSCSPADRPGPCPRPMPRRASKRQQSPRGQLASFLHCSAGDCDGADKTFGPALCPSADNHPRLARGGPPASMASTTPLSSPQKNAFVFCRNSVL